MWLPPAAIAVTPLRPVTSCGVLAFPSVLPVPSSPSQLEPQHFTPPLLINTQVWFAPAAIDTTPLLSPVTLCGVYALVVPPFPKWPFPLYPQHFAPPPLVTTHVCSKPAAIATTLLSPVTFCGALAYVIPPFPKP